MDTDPQSAPAFAFVPADPAPPPVETPAPMGETEMGPVEVAAATEAPPVTAAETEAAPAPEPPPIAMEYRGPEALAGIPRRSLTAEEVTVWVRTAEAAQQAFDDDIYVPGPAMPDLPSATPRG
jgi:hypothetical protein